MSRETIIIVGGGYAGLNAAARTHRCSPIPGTIINDLKEKVSKFVEIPALPLATEAGNSKSTNVVLMGTLFRYMDFPDEVWQAAMDLAGVILLPKCIVLYTISILVFYCLNIY